MARQDGYAPVRRHGIRCALRCVVLRHRVLLVHLCTDAQRVRRIERSARFGSGPGSAVLFSGWNAHDAGRTADRRLGRIDVLSGARADRRTTAGVDLGGIVHGSRPAVEIHDCSAGCGDFPLHGVGSGVAPLVSALGTLRGGRYRRGGIYAGAAVERRARVGVVCFPDVAPLGRGAALFTASAGRRRPRAAQPDRIARSGCSPWWRPIRSGCDVRGRLYAASPAVHADRRVGAVVRVRRFQPAA